MVPLLETTLPSVARAAGAAHCPDNAITHGRYWRLVGMVCLSLAMSASAESVQTEIIEPNASAVAMTARPGYTSVGIAAHPNSIAARNLG